MIEIGKKTISAQVQQIVAKAKQTPVLVASVDLLDKSGEINVPVSVLEAVADSVHKQHSTTSFMLVAAGTHCCQLLAVRGENADDRLSATQWVLSCNVDDSAFGSDGKAHGQVNCTQNQSPLKRKDELIQMAFDYLRQNDLMPDEDSSEEIIGLDFDLQCVSLECSHE